MRRTADPSKPHEARLERLARKVDALTEKDEAVMRHARDIVSLRHAAACELFRTCRDFVDGLNRLVTSTEITLDPPEFARDSFLEHASNLFQINVRGRILQIEFEATPDLVSTEDFRIPYTLQGYVRAFNQALLDKNLIEEQLLFYTVEKEQGMWRFFDSRTYRSGPFDQEYLTALMEQLL